MRSTIRYNNFEKLEENKYISSEDREEQQRHVHQFDGHVVKGKSATTRILREEEEGTAKELGLKESRTTKILK